MLNETDIRIFLRENIHANLDSSTYEILRGKYINFKDVRVRFGIFNLNVYPKTVFIAIIYPKKMGSAVKYEFEYKHFCEVFNFKEMDKQLLELLIVNNLHNLTYSLMKDGNISVKTTYKRTKFVTIRTQLNLIKNKIYVKRPVDYFRQVMCDN